MKHRSRIPTLPNGPPYGVSGLCRNWTGGEHDRGPYRAPKPTYRAKLGLRILGLTYLLMLMLCPLAQAQSLTVTCEPPPKNADGSALAAGTSFSYALYGAKQGSPKVQVAQGLNTCSSVQTVTPGTWCYEAAAIAWLPGTTPSAESAHTLEVCGTAVAITPTPGPPGNLTVTPVTTSTIAYMIVGGADTLSPLIVGTVPLGIPCDAQHEALGLMIVPRAQVTFTSPIKALAVLARCT